MTTLTHDGRVAEAVSGRSAAGLGFAALSAASFGLAGALASGLMDSGWSAAGAVTARVTVASLVLLVPALIALDGRWALLRTEFGTVVVYGIVAVAGCQLAYFNAVRQMEVGVALLIEYTAPVAVLGWLWLRHGQRPGRLTFVGSAVAAVGLVLVLDIISGAVVSVPGVLWSLGAMAGAAVYFVLSARESELPPLVLAASGLILGAGVLLLAGLIGIVRLQGSTQEVDYAGTQVPFWLPILGLGVVSAAVAYVAGIEASRRLGSRLASFVALLEVLFALVFAWILLDQLPRGIQLLGAVLILGGVVIVKLGERSVSPRRRRSPSRRP